MVRPRARNGFSMHFPKRKNGRDEWRFWNRPCFHGYDMVAIGDSLIKSFGKKRYFIKGASINAFGGMDLLELISMLRKGSLVSNIGNSTFRRDLINGTVNMQLVRSDWFRQISVLQIGFANRAPSAKKAFVRLFVIMK